MKQIFIVVLLMVSSVAYSENSLNISLGGEISLELNRKKFDCKGQNILYLNKVHGYIGLIDGYLLFGTDGTIPAYTLDSAVLVVGNKKIKLQTEGMFDPWLEYDLNAKNFRFETLYKSSYRLRGVFSVASGIYGVEWIIIDDVAYRTIITNDWNILDAQFVDM